MTGDSSSSPGRLALRLALFAVAGAAGAVVLWHALNDLLAGRPLEGPAWLLALAGVLVVLLIVALGRFVKRL